MKSGDPVRVGYGTPVVVGALAFAGVHLVLVRYWEDIPHSGAEQQAWWLNSGEGIVLTLCVLVVVGALAAVWRSGSPWRTAVAVIAGVMVSATAILFSIGHGTIFPIVLWVCLVLASGGVFAGVGMVQGLRAAGRWMGRAGAEGDPERAR